MPAISSSSAQLWTMAGGGSSRTGSFPKPVRLDPERWRCLKARGALQASVVFDAQDRAIVADMAGCAQAYTNEGQPLWQQQLDGGVSATPAVDAEGGRVFIGTHAGWVYSLRCADGVVLWRQRLPSKSDSRIISDLLHVPAQNRVVLSSWGGRFHSLAAASGETMQTWDAGLSPQAAAAADAEGNVYCLRAVRGEGVILILIPSEREEAVVHRQPEGARGAQRTIVAAAPIMDETRGVVYFVTNTDRESDLHAWSRREERLLWSRHLPHAVVTTPALGAGGAVVIADMSGAVHGLAPDGFPAFRYTTNSEYLLGAPVCDSEGNVFLGDPLGFLHVVDRAGAGRPVFEAARSIQARPSFDRWGNLYLAATDRSVYVFRNQA